MFAACGKSNTHPEQWTKRPLEPMTVSVNGVSMTIDVPEGIRQGEDEFGLGGVKLHYPMQWEGATYDKAPHITLRKSSLATSAEESSASSTH